MGGILDIRSSFQCLQKIDKKNSLRCETCVCLGVVFQFVAAVAGDDILVVDAAVVVIVRGSSGGDGIGGETEVTLRGQQHGVNLVDPIARFSVVCVTLYVAASTTILYIYTLTHTHN